LTLGYTTMTTGAGALEGAGARVHTVGADKRGSVDLVAVLQDLAGRHCNEVLVEAGPVLSGRFLELGLADALITYMSPIVLGSEARSMLALPAIDDMQRRLELDLVEHRQVGKDIRFTWKPRGRNQG